MAGRVVSFQVDLAAGRTEIAPANEHVIWREHGMDGWILNCTVAGCGRIGRGDGRFTVGPGELLLFKPRVAHDYGFDPDVRHWGHLWVYFFPRPDWYEWLAWPEAAPGIPRLDLSRHPLRATVVTLFEELIAVARSTQRRRTALAMSVLEQLLLWCDAAAPTPAVGVDPRLQHALAWMAARAEQPLRVQAIARACGMSPSRFAHRFRAELGVSPLRWLERHRIGQARELLLMTGRPIAEIAGAVGFADATWFARVFRRHAGVTPGTFRRRGG